MIMLEYFLLIHALEEKNIGVLKVNIKEKGKVIESPDFEKNLKAALEIYFLGQTVVIHEIRQVEDVFIEIKVVATIGDHWNTIISLSETAIY
jgi:hypothetical protein